MFPKLALPQPTPRRPPFRKAILGEYQHVCGKINHDDPHHFGSEPSSTLIHYQNTFGEQLGLYERSISFGDVATAAQDADAVYVGDFHSSRSAKDTFRRIVAEGAARRRKRVILLEEFPAKHNRHLKAYLQGSIDDNGLRSKAWAYDQYGSWSGVLGIVQYAKENGIAVWGIDQRGESLSKRTEIIAEHVKRSIADRTQLFVLAGELHLVPCRVPKILESEVKSSIIIFQGPDEMFYQLLASGVAYGTEAVQTSTGVYCLNNSNPLIRAMVQQNAALHRSERLEKIELDDNYLDCLVTILSSVLGVSGAAINPNAPGLRSTLEQLVGGNVTRKKALQVFKGLVPKD